MARDRTYHCAVTMMAVKKSYNIDLYVDGATEKISTAEIIHFERRKFAPSILCSLSLALALVEFDAPRHCDAAKQTYNGMFESDFESNFDKILCHNNICMCIHMYIHMSKYIHICKKVLNVSIFLIATPFDLFATFQCTYVRI